MVNCVQMTSDEQHHIRQCGEQDSAGACLTCCCALLCASAKPCTPAKPDNGQQWCAAAAQCTWQFTRQVYPEHPDECNKHSITPPCLEVLTLLLFPCTRKLLGDPPPGQQVPLQLPIARHGTATTKGTRIWLNTTCGVMRSSTSPDCGRDGAVDGGMP